MQPIVNIGRWKKVIRLGSICWMKLSTMLYLLQKVYIPVMSCYSCLTMHLVIPFMQKMNYK